MAAILERNHVGVLLRYSDPGDLRDYHVDDLEKCSDRERQALVRQRDALVEAERRLRTIRIALADICSDAAGYILRWLDEELGHIGAELNVVRYCMNTTRDRLGMSEAEPS